MSYFLFMLDYNKLSVQFKLFLIHSLYCVTLVKMPGAPMPHLEVPPDTTPTSCQGEILLFRAKRGPPLSPLQLSFPSSPPAQRCSEGLQHISSPTLYTF